MAGRGPTTGGCHERVRRQVTSSVSTGSGLRRNSELRVYGAKDMEKKELKPYVIVRTHSAGVFAGTLQSRSGKEVVLTRARRLW